MKRVYRAASVIAGEEGHAIALDGRTVKTPGRRSMIVASGVLAKAIRDEWEAQRSEIEPLTMPFTRLAATAIDRVTDHRARVVDEIATYGATDLLCYRAEAPAELVERQRRYWQPLLDWLDERYGARLRTTHGVMACEQPAEALAALRAEIDAMDTFSLAAMLVITASGGSLVLALALADGRVTPEEAWALSQVDESFQSERWGADEEAEGHRETAYHEMLAAARFLAHCRATPEDDERELA